MSVFLSIARRRCGKGAWTDNLWSWGTQTGQGRGAFKFCENVVDMWGKSSMGLAYWVKVCEEKNAIANFGVHTADVSHSTKTAGLNFKPQQRSESAFSVFFLWKESKLQYPGGKGAQIWRVVLQSPLLMIERHWTTVCHTPTNS